MSGDFRTDAERRASRDNAMVDNAYERGRRIGRSEVVQAIRGAFTGSDVFLMTFGPLVDEKAITLRDLEKVLVNYEVRAR